MAKKKTIYNVAEEAGVSISTVSRVFSGSGYVSPETRAKVEKACENYHPPQYAKEGKAKKSDIIGIVISHEPDYFFLNTIYNQALVGISRVAKENGIRLLLDINNNVDDVVGLYNDRKVDGFLLMGVRQSSTMVERMAKEAIPFVIIGSYHGSVEGVCQIDINDKQAMHEATSYLIGLGHERIGIITGSLQFPSCSDRLAGYCEALREAGIEVNDGYIETCENITEVKAENLAKKLLYMPNRVTAIVAFNDMVAMSVYKAAKDLGIKIPGEISVVGFDDSRTSAYLVPPLTSVWQPSFEKGERALEVLVAALAKGELPKAKVEMTCITIYRDSCAAPGKQR